MTPCMISDHQILNIFAENVRFFRKKQKISQEELACRAGLHKNFIGMIERAERAATLLSLEKIALALEVGFDDLLLSREQKPGQFPPHSQTSNKSKGINESTIGSKKRGHLS